MDDGGWVFGYGSLMWDPGFVHAERRPALVLGWHRRFSILSTRKWGTPEAPGLSAALHRGGRATGMAFRVAAADWPDAIAYLDDRERAYRRRTVRLRLGAEAVAATTYVYEPAHPAAGDHLAEAQRARLIAAATGPAGASRDYLARTIACLEAMGVRPEQRLRRLAALVQDAAAAA